MSGVEVRADRCQRLRREEVKGGADAFGCRCLGIFDEAGDARAVKLKDAAMAAPLRVRLVEGEDPAFGAVEGIQKRGKGEAIEAVAAADEGAVLWEARLFQQKAEVTDSAQLLVG